MEKTIVREGDNKTLLMDQGNLPAKQLKQDFKMVTFSLGGKDYGIDIMKVKEIAKFSQFTYVPNTPPFVRGVYNLRGEIISIIDLRLFFPSTCREAEGWSGERADPSIGRLHHRCHCGLHR